jgi:pimeloyl-ACP methyl ester carboxylesterase
MAASGGSPQRSVRVKNASALTTAASPRLSGSKRVGWRMAIAYSDRIVDPGYGRAYAGAIPGAEFRILAATGHVPQIETPGQLPGAIQGFAASPKSA